MSRPPRPVEIRRAEVGDAEDIRTIYNWAVTQTTFTFDLVPRTPAAQQAWIRSHSGAHPAIVAQDGAGRVVGFAALGPYRDRPAYSTTVEDSVYVHRDHTRRGVGRALLGELLALATSHGFHAVIGRVVGGHVASIALHEALGFELVGVEREVGRKFGRWLDVAVMERLL